MKFELSCVERGCTVDFFRGVIRFSEFVLVFENEMIEFNSRSLSVAAAEYILFVVVTGAGVRDV